MALLLFPLGDTLIDLSVWSLLWLLPVFSLGRVYADAPAPEPGN